MTKNINISISEEMLEKMDKKREELSLLTRCEFVRNAISEKIGENNETN